MQFPHTQIHVYATFFLLCEDCCYRRMNEFWLKKMKNWNETGGYGTNTGTCTGTGSGTV